MKHHQSFIDSSSVDFAGTRFHIQVIDLYPDHEDRRKYHFCWQVTCEGVTSPQKDALLSFNDMLDELPEMNDEAKAEGARTNLSNFGFWNDQGVVSICFQDGSPNAKNHMLYWHTKLKTFNPIAWAT
jgi:hypothetical protein